MVGQSRPHVLDEFNRLDGQPYPYGDVAERDEIRQDEAPGAVRRNTLGFSCGVSCRSGEGRMGLKGFGVFQGLLVLSLLAACSSPPQRTLSLHAPLYATLP